MWAIGGLGDVGRNGGHMYSRVICAISTMNIYVYLYLHYEYHSTMCGMELMELVVSAA